MFEQMDWQNPVEIANLKIKSELAIADTGLDFREPFSDVIRLILAQLQGDVVGLPPPGLCSSGDRRSSILQRLWRNYEATCSRFVSRVMPVAQAPAS
jgi:hypothetical protein